MRAGFLGQLAAPDIGETLRGIARGGDVGCDGRIGNVAVEVCKVPDGAAVWHEELTRYADQERHVHRLWDMGVAYLSQGKTVQLRDNTNLLAQEPRRA